MIGKRFSPPTVGFVTVAAQVQGPKVIGFQRISALSGDADLHRAAAFFWESVTTKRSVSIGGNSLNAFRPDTIGSDGSKATLRSFQNYRFRDRDLLVMQAEYRIPIRASVDATVFYDAGQVAGRVSDLFGGIKQGAGFSVSYMTGNATLIRMDVGHGGGEGLHLVWSFGTFGL